MTWTPHATVAVIVEDDRGRFLMVLRCLQDYRDGRRYPFDAIADAQT
ncbi:MAG: hypothetical protein SV598_03920 [Pseudomonadota bacterium]|nr:hypothetical protein [Pseudomonadota bacterium]